MMTVMLIGGNKIKTKIQMKKVLTKTVLPIQSKMKKVQKKIVVPTKTRMKKVLTKTVLPIII
jgi:hypothetical protein